MRALYDLLWYLALPWLPLRLWWRGRKEPGYRARIGERFGTYAGTPQRDVIWVHAVSAGETRAAAPLIERLLREWPDARVLVTAMTATGDAAARSLYGNRVTQAWLPYDLPFAMSRFIANFAPRAGIVMETEVWPNLMHACEAADVPVYLVNARLSPHSAAGYAKLGALARTTFARFAGVAAQSADDAARLRQAGAINVEVSGNLKFDIDVPPAQQALASVLRGRFGAARPVLVAASTRDGEEALLIEALNAAPLPGNALVVIVPRHPQRFDAVAALLDARGCAFCRRSDDRDVPAGVGFLLGDSMGELAAYYAASDVAFVGGSLLPFGGQNLIEPIALGVPTIVGDHTFNFADAARDAVAAGAALRVDSATALVAVASELLVDAAGRATMRKRALAFHAAHRGAIDRLWLWLSPQLATRAAHGASAINRNGGPRAAQR
ncbi:MAG: lipid IV(A) 3-deoxy-D-manno-octulosonic acid transferase [Betaproteobacteria bacterium]